MRILLVLLVSLVHVSAHAQTQNNSSEDPSMLSSRLESLVDSMAGAYLDSNWVAGLSVGVVKGADTLLLRRYGYADLEYEIPTPRHGVYRIGSITKQFTAAGIMRLVEEGKIDLASEIGDYLPDFNAQNRSVTVARLLDHTSGIQGYTEMPEFWRLAVQELPRDTLVALFGSWPFWHEPGEQMIYNNSAYFLLGLLIEEVADTTYEAFLQREFFEPLGMDDSRYCSNTEIVRHRMHGYSWSSDGLRRANYLSHVWPYSAGSICSSVEDLITWNRALHGGSVLRASSYERMITPQPLASGDTIQYAAGLLNTTVEGRKKLQHGGGINGFLSDAMIFPEEEIIIVVLINTTGPANPGDVSQAITDALFGEESIDTNAIDFDAEEVLGKWAGRGRGGALNYSIVLRDSSLILVRSENDELPLVYRGAQSLSSSSGPPVISWGIRNGQPALLVDSGYSFYVLHRED